MKPPAGETRAEERGRRAGAGKGVPEKLCWAPVESCCAEAGMIRSIKVGYHVKMEAWEKVEEMKKNFLSALASRG